MILMCSSSTSRPTASIPNQKHEVRGMIKRMGQNKAIIFSTHILEEVEAACSRAIIIDRGKVVADGTPDSLKKLVPGANSLDEVFRSITKPDTARKRPNNPLSFQTNPNPT
jgi:ABC-2 type transport system ATP-binding protein